MKEVFIRRVFALLTLLVAAGLGLALSARAEGPGKGDGSFKPLENLTPSTSSEDANGGESSILDRDESPVIRPVGAKPEGADANRVPRGYTPDEDSMLIERRCTIRQVAHTGWYMVQFPPKKDGKTTLPRLALPCPLLEQIEPMADQDPPPVLRVSGENTLYKGKMFLFLREVAVVPANHPAPAPSPQVASQPAVSAVAEPNQSSSAPAQASTRPATTAPVGPRKGLDSDDILRLLAQDRPSRLLLTPVPDTQPQTAPSVAPVPQDIQALPSIRGNMIVDRLVRILPEDDNGWTAARFEADNTLQEMPLRLLPSHRLEEAERTSNKTNGARFLLTGEVTQYKGRSYVLIRSIRLDRPMGQF